MVMYRSSARVIARGISVAIAFAPVAFAPIAMAAQPGALAPEEIQTTFFTGQPFTASTTSNVKFKMTFAADGTMKRQPAAGGGAKGEGTWKLSKEGFCTTWKGSRTSCFVVVKAGDNKWSVLKGSSILATWSK
jgi:hypothetical protein